MFEAKSNDEEVLESVKGQEWHESWVKTAQNELCCVSEVIGAWSYEPLIIPHLNQRIRLPLTSMTLEIHVYQSILI